MARDAVNITYETLFDLLRNEKNEPLQRLPENFHADLVSYMKDKIALIEGKSGAGVLSDPERDKNAKQLESIYRLIKEIYERRETKVVNIAIVSARGLGLEENAFLPHEERLFLEMTALLKEARGNVLSRLLKGELPLDSSNSPNLDHSGEQKPSPHTTPPIPEVAPVESQEVPQPAAASPTPTMTTSEGPHEETREQISEKTDAALQMVRFLSHVPKFVGKEMEIYGPFDPGDMASLPARIAQILVEKERAAPVQTQLP